MVTQVHDERWLYVSVDAEERDPGEYYEPEGYNLRHQRMQETSIDQGLPRAVMIGWSVS